MWVIDKLKSYWARIGPWAAWSFPLKLILSALGAIGGAGILGFLSDYATYWYALSIGVRPPLEGVPYLSTAVAFISLSMLLTGAVCFIGVFGLFSFLLSTPQRVSLWILRPFGYESTPEEIREGPFANMKKASMRERIFFVLGLTVTIVILAMAASFIGLWDIREVVPGYKVEWYWGVLLGFFWTLILSTILIFPALKWPTSVVFTLVYFICAIVLLFQPVVYGELLRRVGYGGGLPITLHCKDTALQNKLENGDLSLMLRTMTQ